MFWSTENQDAPLVENVKDAEKEELVRATIPTPITSSSSNPIFNDTIAGKDDFLKLILKLNQTLEALKYQDLVYKKGIRNNGLYSK